MFVTRFAPSPTGYLHRGHALSALTAHAAARQAKGRFLLRIENIDATRCRPAFEMALLEDLAWLGLEWETPVRRQADHFDDYRAALSHLGGDGLLYRCFRTRKEVALASASAPHGDMEVFTGGPLSAADEAQRLTAGEPFAWRLSLGAAESKLGGFSSLTFTDDAIPVTARPDLGGDVVLARKDVGVAYHLAVVVDDALQGITHVVRGDDLRDATHVQRLLQALLGLPTPSYRHHSLLLDAGGCRLAKRNNAETLRSLRERGMSAVDLRGELGFD